MESRATDRVHQERVRQIARVLWVVLVLNLAVAATKLVFGLRSGALSLFADGIHALLDASSNVIGLVGIFVAARPPDAGHPYGHRRFETIAALLIGVFIAGGMLEIGLGLFSAVQGRRAAPDITWLTAALVAVTIVANIFISRYESRRGRDLRSAVLTADAGHTMSDALGAISVLLSFAFIAVGFAWADMIAAVIVMVLIARTAYGVLRTNLGVLTDRAQLDPHEVRRIALGVEGVRGAHKIRSRGPADYVQVDLHIHVDPRMHVERAHRLTHAVADAIRDAFPDVADVIIHTEPADGREYDLQSIAPPEKP